MNTKILQLHSDTRKDIFWVSVSVIGLCICAYIYLVTTTVQNIVLKRQISMQSSDLSSKISMKEFNYIALQDKVTLDYATKLGFADPKQKVFITPTSVSFVSSKQSSNGAI